MKTIFRAAPVAALCVCLFTAVLDADHLVLRAEFDPSVGPNQYEVNFPPELGGETVIMPINGGNMQLEISDEDGTSRLLGWVQQVEPIEIFGMSTGPIDISLVPGSESSGTFNAEERSFAVEADFQIAFDDSALKEFGFVSPFIARATEVGNIYGDGGIGRIHMSLDGAGTAGPSDFNYTCQTSARFEYDVAPNQAQPGDVNRDRRLNIADPVAMLNFVFNGDPISCAAAGNVNDDASFNSADPVYLLNYIFRGGDSPPVAPVDCE